MKIFISWSGTRSRVFASALHEKLPLMIPEAEVFMSKQNIEGGERSLSRIAKELGDTAYGVLCLTPENFDKPWTVFEAGALTKHGDGRACGLLLGDLEPTDVTGPLAQFQHRRFAKDEFEQLLKEMNTLQESPRTVSQLSELFTAFWPSLEGAYADAVAQPLHDSPRPQRTDRDVIDEILRRVRMVERRVSRSPRAASGSRHLRSIGSNLIRSSGERRVTELSETEEEILLREHLMSEATPQHLRDLLASKGWSLAAMRDVMAMRWEAWHPELSGGSSAKHS